MSKHYRKNEYKFRVTNPELSFDGMINGDFIIEVIDIRTRKRVGRYPYNIALSKFGGNNEIR
jgi:hypothetical protein